MTITITTGGGKFIIKEIVYTNEQGWKVVYRP